MLCLTERTHRPFLFLFKFKVTIVNIISISGKKKLSQSRWDKKKAVLHHYDRLARIYDSLYGEEQNTKIKSILKILKIECKDLVLDVGCGTGLLIKHVASKVTHFVGIDLSGKAIKIASERSCRLGIKEKVSLIQADVDNLPFRDDVFDRIFALTLLQNVPEPNETIKEIVRVAKSGSQIAVTGLKKHFTEEKFRRIIGEIEGEHIPVKTSEIHDVIIVINLNKAKNKYMQREEIER